MQKEFSALVVSIMLTKKKKKTDIAESFGRIEPLIEKSKVLRH